MMFRRHESLTILSTLGLVIVLAAISPPPRAQAEVIERVVGVVNDRAIYLSDLRQRALPFLERLASVPASRREEGRQAIYAQVVEQLINEELIRQAAMKLEIRVTNQEVESAVRNVIEQNNLTPEEFWEAVYEQGFSEAQYRKNLRDQLLHMKVMNQRVRARVNITERDVRREYERRARQANQRLRFRASHIFFPFPAGAGVVEIAEIRDRAIALRRELRDESSFQAALGSEIGGHLGWLNQGDLPRELEEGLATLARGEISEPVLGPAGYHIFLLHERERAGASEIPPYDAVKDEIYRSMLDEAMERQEALFLEELRRDAEVKILLELGPRASK